MLYSLPVHTHKGKVWRHLPVGGQPLHLKHILRAGGRWNRIKEYGCLYTSLSKSGAIAEIHKMLNDTDSQADEQDNQRDLVSLKVELTPVMDLTNPEVSPVDPAEPWLTGNTPKDLEKCRKLADKLRKQGYVGIIYPSAAAQGEKNLAIYIDGRAGDIKLDEGGDRITINL